MLCKRTWYTILIILRILCIFLPGYIHPDEFFQTPEIIAGDVFGFKVFKAWEYTAEWPCRSITIPAIVNGIPFAFLKFLHNTLNQYGWDVLPINSLTLLITERLPFVFLTFLFDLILFKFSKLYQRDPYPALLVLSSSYTLLVYFTRPFSNATEAVILALSGYVLQSAVVSPPPNKKTDQLETFKMPSTKVSLILGLLFALGSFTRITFVIYALPVGCAYLYAVGTKTLFDSRKANLSRLTTFITTAFPLFAGIALSSFVMILIDSIYFGSLQISSVSQLCRLLLNPISLLSAFRTGKLVITPLNNVIYNSSKENLSLHGLHPWYLHLLVYTPLLFGPLAYLMEKGCRQAVYHCKFYSGIFLKTVFAYSAVFGILVLSLMPHQEARFLLPMLFPVILILSDKFKSTSRGFWSILTIFNIIGFVVFGILHQGGIVPVLRHIQHEINEPVFCSFYDEHIHCRYSYSLQDKELDSQFKLKTNLIFYKTYMPPQHLLTMKQGAEGKSAINFVDLAGAPLDVLQETVTSYHGVSASSMQSETGTTAAVFKITPNDEFERTLLVVPSVVELGPLKNRLKLIHRQWGHLNTDYFDKIIYNPLGSLYLDVYTVLDSTD